MASTTRKGRKRKVTKKVVKKGPSRTKSKKISTHLDLADLREIENLSKDVIIAQKDMALEEQSLRNMNLEYKLAEQRIISQREAVVVRADRYEKYKEKYAAFKSKINPKYGLSEGEPLGYNPETGEIIKS